MVYIMVFKIVYIVHIEIYFFQLNVQEQRLHELQQQREELTRLAQEAAGDAREAATLEAGQGRLCFMENPNLKWLVCSGKSQNRWLFHGKSQSNIWMMKWGSPILGHLHMKISGLKGAQILILLMVENHPISGLSLKLLIPR